MFRPLLFLALVVGLAPPAHAAEEQWAWFAAISNIDKWNTETGMARVSMSNGVFEAKLFIGDYLLHEIKGTIKGDKVKVLLSTSETDQVDYPLQGQYKRNIWKDPEDAPSLGRETIELTGAGFVVGFTREMPKPQLPEKGAERKKP